MLRWFAGLLICIVLLLPASFANEQLFYERYKAAVDAFNGRNYAQAETVLLQALKEAPAQDPNIVYARHLLGQAYLRQDKYDAAVPLLLEALAFYQEGDAPTFLGSTLDQLGFIEHKRQNYQQAYDYFAQAKSVWEKHQPGSREAGMSLFNMANATLQLKNPEQSKVYFIEAANILKSHMAPSDPLLESIAKQIVAIDTYLDANQLKDSYDKGRQSFSQGNRLDAYKNVRIALEKAKKLHGPEHPLVKDLEKRLFEIYAMSESEDYVREQRGKIVRWSDKTKDINVLITSGEDVPNWKPEYGALIKLAFLAWQEALNNRITINYVTKSKQADVFIRWADKQPKIGESKYRYAFNAFETTGEYLSKNDIQIFLNGKEGEPLSADKLYSVLLHEIGHLMGLREHSTNPADIMFSYDESDWQAKKELSRRDIATINALYSKRPTHTNPDGYRLAQFEKFERKVLRRPSMMEFMIPMPMGYRF